MNHLQAKTRLRDCYYDASSLTSKQQQQLRAPCTVMGIFPPNDLFYISKRDGYKSALKQLKELLPKNLTSQAPSEPVQKKKHKKKKMIYYAHRNKKSSKSNGIATFGQYFVEEILDCALDTDGRMVYLVKWEGWGTEDNTWEVEENLSECQDALNKFYVKMGDRPAKYSKDEVEAFIYHLKTIVASDYKDLFVLLKLNNKSLSSYDNDPKSLIQLKENIRMWKNNLNGISQITNNQERVNALKKINIVADKLHVFKYFESINNFIEFFEKRKKQLQELADWQERQNKAIRDKKDGPPIFVENNADLEIPPDLEYLTSYRVTGPDGEEIVLDEKDTPIHGCDCDDCFENRHQCCTSVIGFPMAYDGLGLLKKETGIIFECNSSCKCKLNCPNRSVQRGRKFSLTVFRTDKANRGWGVKTNEQIERGSFVMEYVGEMITLGEANIRPRTYLFDLDSKLDSSDVDFTYVVDAFKYGNIARFINHSCNPNMVAIFTWINHYDRLRPRIALFARRRIKVNEELTYDYGMQLMDVVDPEANEGDENLVYSSDSDSEDVSEEMSEADSGISPSKKEEEVGLSDNLAAAGRRISKFGLNRSHHDNSISPSVEQIDCLCGASNCVKTLYV